MVIYTINDGPEFDRPNKIRRVIYVSASTFSFMSQCKDIDTGEMLTVDNGKLARAKRSSEASTDGANSELCGAAAHVATDNTKARTRQRADRDRR